MKNPPNYGVKIIDPTATTTFKRIENYSTFFGNETLYVCTHCGAKYYEEPENACPFCKASIMKTEDSAHRHITSA